MKNRIETTSTPPYCSACFSQDGKLRYIDFDACSDRGYGENGTRITMDDLILCEDCVRRAAQMLGWDDVEGYKKTINERDKALKREREKRRVAEDFAESMTLALESKYEPRQKTSGRPKGSTKEMLNA